MPRVLSPCCRWPECQRHPGLRRRRDRSRRMHLSWPTSFTPRASDLAKTTGLCSACLAQTTAVGETTATLNLGAFATEMTSDSIVESTSQASSNTATITTGPNGTRTFTATKTISSAISTNTASAMHNKGELVSWKVGFTMGAMLITGAFAGLLI
ncbi:hypothetical protein J3F83DRAFT_734105 [Trichoderma novae-zelandiae]